MIFVNEAYKADKIYVGFVYNDAYIKLWNAEKDFLAEKLDFVP